jgi:hypothetical protein
MHISPSSRSHDHSPEHALRRLLLVTCGGRTWPPSFSRFHISRHTIACALIIGAPLGVVNQPTAGISMHTLVFTVAREEPVAGSICKVLII